MGNLFDRTRIGLIGCEENKDACLGECLFKLIKGEKECNELGLDVFSPDSILVGIFR